jgi:hypothetical protein
MDNIFIANEPKKGSRCSVEGNRYEKIVHSIVKCCQINGKQFNSQNESELGGSNSNNDIECNFIGTNDVPIEIKKKNTPDWMQCSLKYNGEKWVTSLKNKIPDNSKDIFSELISGITLFNGHIPAFMQKDITYEEWIKIKRENPYFNDMYIGCLDNTIKRLYREKGCYYIQISEKGLYHLGEDICGFNVPEFTCEQQLRVRTKIHTKKNSKGFCKLSVMLACQPKNIKNLVKSQYSLDNKERLPSNLHFIDRG